MRNLFRFFLTVFFLAAFAAGPLFAKTSKKTDAKSDGKTTPNHTETQSFSGLKLKGQLKKPDLSYIYKRKGLRSEQIVDIPENFDNEIIQGTGTF